MNHKGRKSRRVLIVTFSLVLTVVAFLALRATTSGVFAFSKSFKSIVPGMTETQVLARLGEADERSAKFRLGQRNGYEREYERAARSGSEYYLLWHRYLDLTYAVGFDKGGVVTMKAAGGT